eukprot:CAMPEP_0168259836 /NCGR_PEP_ID=MMETSP0141_2-20121125/7984_1 /TAXON_ID=44445 /ORGANISM="Pseudo-nitzschia australis, Strain 10249 10 AB" /LENGTH=76 /DNA_ID=CAMNT_0008197397 /DNA_START=225 /DNA_END=452 /DNA_ORIENTATION=+
MKYSAVSALLVSLATSAFGQEDQIDQGHRSTTASHLPEPEPIVIIEPDFYYGSKGGKGGSLLRKQGRQGRKLLRKQ